MDALRSGLRYLAGGVVGALVLYTLLPAPPEPPAYSRVIVERTAIEQAEPDTVIRWRDRLVTVAPPPVVVATAPGGGVEHVADFCLPAVLAAAGDTATTPPRLLLLRSGSLARGWPFQKGTLVLTGPTSDGDLVQGAWHVGGGAAFRVVGDSVLVRHSRFWWARDAVTVVVPFLLGHYSARLF